MKAKYLECTYCGIDTNTLIVVKEKNKTSQQIPCCKECNQILKGIPFTSLSTQAKFVSDSLTNKNKKLLNSPNWSDEELQELEGMLKKKVKHLQAKKLKLINRIRWSNTIAMINNLSVDFVVLTVSNSKSLMSEISNITNK